MKNKINFFEVFSVLVLLLFIPLKVYAQNEIGILLRSGVSDAKVMAKAYLKPLASSVGGGVNTGWVTSASVHQPLSFSLHVRSSLAFIPETDRQFNISELPLEVTRIAKNQSSTLSPTVGGVNEPGPKVVVTNEGTGTKVTSFELPPGSGYHIVPSPMIQASVGVGVNTDIILRFVPKIAVGDFGKFKMKGIGLKHEITEWFPADNNIPVDISILAGFNHVDLSAELNVKPQPGTKPDPNYNGSYDNQKVNISFNTFTAKVIIGKSWPFLDIYAATGFETSTMTVVLRGDYPIPAKSKSGETQTTTITNPFKFKQKGENTYSLTAGATLKLFFFDLFAQYTLSKYSVFNAGVGFSF